jgi:uncharacterized membrane protein YdjX (TVP38/TMEM64 family)
MAYLLVDTLTSQRALSGMVDLNKWIQSSGKLGVAYMAVIIAACTVTGLPVTVFIIGGGFVFNESYGNPGILVNVATAFVGCAVGSVLSFLLGRYLFRDAVRAQLSKSQSKYVRAFDILFATKGTKMSLLLRIVPYVPWNVFNYVAGVTSMKLLSFVLGSVGMIPWIGVCTFIGSGINSLDDAASGASAKDKRVNLGILIGGLIITIGASAAVTVYGKRVLKEMNNNKSFDGRELEESDVEEEEDLENLLGEKFLKDDDTEAGEE